MGMKNLLKELGNDLEAIEAEDFDSAQEAIDDSGDLDLVILDVNIPGFESGDAVSEVCQRVPDTPIVVTSASDEFADVQKAIDQGAVGFMLKSTRPEIMLNALRLVLAGGVYIPASVVRRAGSGLRESRQRSYEALRGDQTSGLTPRQLDVLGLLALGKSNKDIARELELAEGTVKVHISAIFKALNVSNRTEAVIKATDLHGSGGS